ncbi:Pyrimidine pathway regulatory protein 1 [Yarrowia lipolytica]|nr:Pyrimidine pathway regulatory protein 1 [Yarrowia lipolytica]
MEEDIPTPTEPPSAKQPRQSMARSVSACVRCRKRKSKCDQKFPSCSRCLAAGVVCMGLDAATKREIPRSYVSHLESRIAALEGKLDDAGIDYSDLDTPAASVPIPKPIQTTGTATTPTTSSTATHEDGKNTAPVADLMENVEKASRASHSSTGQDLSFAKLLLTAVKLRAKTKSDRTTPTTTQTQYEACKTLPSKRDAEKRLSQYFCQANSQIPIFHRELFIKNYFVPIYGPFSPGISLASDYTTVEVDAGEAQPVEQPIITSDTPQIPLYFLFIVFGCATSVHQQLYPAGVSESYHQAAMEHIDSAFASANRLEALQAMLVLCLFSIMRPTVPGVWYTLSMALRLCIDLGLHIETSNNRVTDGFDLDMRRRLFWCTYMLDRQICVYLGRPFGIPEDSIRVPFFSELDDSLIVPRNNVDYSLMTSPGGIKSYKYISLAFARVRQIQAEIQRMMFEFTEIPRRFATFADWFQDVCTRLDEWMDSCPNTNLQTNCGFTTTFFALNYHQSRLLLYGVGPKNPSPSAYSLECVLEASKGIMTKYHSLHQIMSINYTWVAVHNLFIAGTCFLYAVYNSLVSGQQLISREDYETVSKQCVVVLDSLIGRCNAAQVCHDTFELLSAAVFKMCFKGGSVLRKVSKDGLVEVIQNHDKRFSHLGALVEQVPDNWNDDRRKKHQKPVEVPVPDLDDFFKEAQNPPNMEMTASLEEPLPYAYSGEVSPQQEDLYSLMSEVPLGSIWDQYFKEGAGGGPR